MKTIQFTKVTGYLLQVAQKIASLGMFLTLAIYWSYLIATSAIMPVLADQNTKLNNPTAINELLSKATHTITITGLHWIIAASITSLAAYILCRKPRDAKQLINNITTIGFCLFNFVFAQAMLRSFLASIS